ncbi:MAG TPA: tripartite tricarboxylate transporter TctB family protein [Microvirga sp.]|jgi:hypothetical protein|nr:tripartite tricarboxylate transporter TctB family protein [Microvirga sp.]
MVSRWQAELAAAAITAGLGLTVMIGSLEYGVAWRAAGPQAGTFPFLMGLLVLIGSAGTAVQATLARRDLAMPVLDREQARRVVSFVGPIVLFVAGSLWLGLYVSGALYLTLVMWLQGGYRPLVSLATGIASAVFFYLVLELAFQVPLLKGPLEAAIGLY